MGRKIMFGPLDNSFRTQHSSMNIPAVSVEKMFSHKVTNILFTEHQSNFRTSKKLYRSEAHQHLTSS